MPSSVILKYHYRLAEQLLEITFVSGSVYVYKNVPLHLVERFEQAVSKGRFFNNYIKERFDFEKR